MFQKPKRIREDGQISRAQFDVQESQASKTPTGPFQRASQSVLANRKMIKTVTKSNDRYMEYIKMVNALNQSFKSWVEEQLAKEGAAADLSEGIADYISYAEQLEERYLKQHGEVLTFGSGDCGQAGHGIDNDEDLEVKWPRIVYSLRDKQVVSVACGGLHNAVCTSDGAVWTWGCGDDGGLGRTGNEVLPAPVGGALEGRVVTQVACGDSHTLALAITGEVYGWGAYKDKEGKAWFDGDGPKDIKKLQKEPYHIRSLRGICEIKCGVSFNIALDIKGQALSWGLGECGELSREVVQMRFADGAYDLEGILRTHLAPAPMRGPGGRALGPGEAVRAVGCGGYHALLVVAGGARGGGGEGGGGGGRVWAAGLNNYGQLGLGDHKDRRWLEPVAELDGCEISQVAGGIHHSLVMSAATGKVYAFGRGDSSQLGVTAARPEVGYCEMTPIEVALEAPARAIACGGNHNLVLTRGGGGGGGGGALYSWGYGDMNQLGHGRDGDENRPKRVNFAKARGVNGEVEVLAMAGGGQHSALVCAVTTTGGGRGQ